ncbi:MAG TPA: TadE/TadG family type IV pilus assembly protein [Candidatus Dormibacteraeota bacterium]
MASARRQRGQSMVEFAISSIVLLLLMTGLLDLSRAFYYSVAIHSAAREGARHGAWFNTSQRQNQYLDDADIKTAVDQTLAGAGIGPSILGTGCPGNPPYNAPYPSSAYGNVGQVVVYICYDGLGNVQGSGTCCTSAPASDNLFWTGKDLNVIVLYNYPLVTGFLASVLGQGIQLAANEHISIQGHA